ncbi:MAG: hypothetical protein HDS65_00850 [Bacteroidales bacterium]|nr:hypothetical protein [Bacteroidales bacterium]
MVISNTNRHIAPYWGEEPSLTPGLNQLGIRNVAEQLFTTMLPGLNNVSIRIRYYSFYCWVIKQFYEGKQAIIDKDFFPFIRRAELLVALINATLDDHAGIPGINFATAQCNKSTKIFSLEEGADIGPGKSTYWANPGGVLRQYYIASLEELNLVAQNKKYASIYNITKTEGYVNGLMLANDFAESVGDAGYLFLSILQRGYATDIELVSLNQAFCMKLMPLNNERDNLLHMLLQPDNPLSSDYSLHRRQTIKFILEFVSKSKCQLRGGDFARYMYDNYHDSDDITAWGWYAYYLDNNWQYQYTQIFHEILSVLENDDKQWIAVDKISDEIANNVLSDFQISPEVTIKELIQSLDDKQRRYPVAEAIRNLLSFYRDNISNCEKSEIYYQRQCIIAENFCNYMNDVKSNLESKVFAYIKRLIVNIIYRHYRVSFRKMLQTQKATQKFVFENGCLRFIDNWDATDTSPRIDTMRNFLIDLSIIQPKDGIDVLTESGLKLLSELSNGISAI